MPVDDLHALGDSDAERVGDLGVGERYEKWLVHCPRACSGQMKAFLEDWSAKRIPRVGMVKGAGLRSVP